jgi:hypothetical protein
MVDEGMSSHHTLCYLFVKQSMELTNIYIGSCFLFFNHPSRKNGIRASQHGSPEVRSHLNEALEACTPTKCKRDTLPGVLLLARVASPAEHQCQKAHQCDSYYRIWAKSRKQILARGASVGPCEWQCRDKRTITMNKNPCVRYDKQIGTEGHFCVADGTIALEKAMRLH